MIAERYRDQLFDRISPEPNTGCWLWMGSLNGARGYPTIGKGQLAHRVSYQLFKGDIPPGLTIDHLCRTKICVNPDHLEAVSLRENILRGDGLAAKCQRKTHCMRGHAFTPDNTLLFIGRNGSTYRSCKACREVYDHGRAR